MNLAKRSILLPMFLRRNFLTATKFRAIKNPCPPTPTSAEFQSVTVRPQFKRLKDNQKKFQVDDGLPVWLKGGLKDKILFQVTLLLIAIGMVMSVQTLYEMAMWGFKW